MFVDTLTTDVPNRSDARPSPESLLKMVQENERAKLRVYIGAAAGVGKTYRMLEDAHQLRDQGIDVVLAFVETHGRSETQDLIGTSSPYRLKGSNIAAISSKKWTSTPSLNAARQLR